jgi:virginiamycin B lyase
MRGWGAVRSLGLTAVLLAGCSGDDGASPASPAPTGSSSLPAAALTTALPGLTGTTAAPGATASTAGAATSNLAGHATYAMAAYPVPEGTAPHDVSPALDGRIWFTAQGSGQLGLLDPASGASQLIDLGPGSRPHGVITAGDGAAWVTDGGRNSLIRVDAATEQLSEHPLPAEAANANLNTAVITPDGTVWFTGQGGWYGRLRPGGAVEVFPAPRGRGPYGITATPAGDVYFASLAGSYVGRIDAASGAATVLEPPVPGQGSRRVWADPGGTVWVSGWDSGHLFAYDADGGSWRSWRLPGDRPQPYAVFVDDAGSVWLSDFGANALVRFDPSTEAFTTFQLPSPGASVRQLHGRPGEVWGAESAADQLVAVRRSA